MRNICVYCSASDKIPQKYVDEAIKLGEAIAKKGATLVYGGGNVGLMGKVARSAQRTGQKSSA
jgi:Predicted Rossmann fold nucleotide-binding protein